MKKNLAAAVMAGTLGIAFAASPAQAVEYGSWILTDTKLLSSQFIPDSDAPTDRYGTWVLIDASMDKQWLANTSRTQPIGSREIGRKMTADKLTYGANFTNRVKNYGEETIEYRNEYDKEELMGTDNYKSVSGSYAYTIQNFRIDNHKDKYLHHPYTSTYHYDETLKHTYNFSITNEVSTRVFFKDAIDHTETSADLVELIPSSVVTETAYATTGKKLSYSQALANEPPRVNSAAALKLAATGDDVTGPFHVVTTGAKQQRMIGESVQRNDKLSSATVENAQDKVLNSNTQVGGKASAKVTSKGIEYYNAQGLDKMKASEKTTTVAEKKNKVGKEFSDSVEKLEDKIEGLSEKATSKKLEEVLQSIAEVYNTADTQDKIDLLKQSVMVAASKASLSTSALQAIENALDGNSASKVEEKNTNSSKANSLNNNQNSVKSNKGTNSQNNSTISPKGSNNHKDKNTVQETLGNTVQSLTSKTPNASLKSNGSNKHVTPGSVQPTPKVTPTPQAVSAKTPVVHATPKVDPIDYLLQNLGGRNSSLAYYLNLARSGGDPLAYIKKAKTYAKSKEDLNAINNVIEEQIGRAKDRKNDPLKKALEILKKF